jgi:hypothetical protein
MSFSPEETAEGEVFYNFERRKLPFNMKQMSGLSVFDSPQEKNR